MKSSIFAHATLCVAILFLSGCAGTNFFRNAERKSRNDHYVHKTYIKEIKQVKIKQNGDVDICIVGNQLNEGGEYTIAFTKAQYSVTGFGVPFTENHDNYDDYQHASFFQLMPDIIKPECNILLADGERELLEVDGCCKNFRKTGFDELEGLPESYEYRNEKKLPFETLVVKYDYHMQSILLKLIYPRPDKVLNDCNPYKDKGDEKKIQIWVPDCHIGERSEVIENQQDYYIWNKPDGFKPADYHAVGVIFDVITAPVQWSLCLISWGYICSPPPFNYPSGG